MQSSITQKMLAKIKMPVKRSKSLSDAPTAFQMHQLPVKCTTILEVTYFDVDEISDCIFLRKPPNNIIYKSSNAISK